MFIGFDTSNYTTSVAAFDGSAVTQYKKMLTVKPGERGLRQSDAVFQHTVNIRELLLKLPSGECTAVGVSTRPRNAEGSYMPCFLVGEGIATAYAQAASAPLCTTSHQVGHILAALWSADRLDFIEKPFYAFHLSGGTTELLLVKPDATEIIKASVVAESLDLKAGQAIDRAGVMLGMTFPCGKELDALSRQSQRSYKIKPSMKGCSCSLSGIENKAKQMLEKGEGASDIAAYVIEAVCTGVTAMLDAVFAQYGVLPVIFSGGVSSNSALRERFGNQHEVYFATSEFSLDNAAGCAIYAYLKTKNRRKANGNSDSITN